MNWTDFKIVNSKKNMILTINWNAPLNVIKNRIRPVGHDVNRHVDVNVLESISLSPAAMEHPRPISVQLDSIDIDILTGCVA